MNDSRYRAPAFACPQRCSSAVSSAGLRPRIDRRHAALLAIVAIALSAAPALAQRGAASQLGNPVTGEPGQVAPPSPVTSDMVVPPPPSYQGEVAPSYQDQIEQGQEAVEPIAAAGEDADAPPAEVNTRLRALDATWQSLVYTGGPNWMNFVVALIGGGLQVGLGAWMATQGPPWDGLAPMLISFGAIGLISPVLRLILRPDASGPALRYGTMPDSSRAEALARMRYGEEQLESYANAFFVMRMIDASVSVGAGVAMGAISIAIFGFDPANPISYFLFLGPAIQLINGIIEFATPTPAEQRWALYVRMRDQLRARRHAGENVSELDLAVPSFTEPRFSFGAAPDPQGGGGFAVLSGTF